MTSAALATFFGFGLVLVLVGTNQPHLADALSLDLARTGLLGAALSLGLGSGVVLAGPLADRPSRRIGFAAAAGLAGLAAVSLAPPLGLPRTLVTLVLLGLGAGATQTFWNAVLSEDAGERGPQRLARLHAAVTLGAVVGPALFALLAEHWGWSGSFRATGLLFLALVLAARRVPAQPPPLPEAPAVAPGWGASLRRLGVYTILCGCYVGAETSLTLFAVPFARDGLGLPESRGLAAISTLWLGLLAGRLAVSRLPGAIGPGLLVLMGLAAALGLGFGAGLRLPHPEALFAGLGLCLGGVFPLTVALGARRLPEARGLATGLVAGAGGVGAVLVPALTGAIGDALGAATAITSLLVWCLAIAALAYHAVRADTPKR